MLNRFSIKGLSHTHWIDEKTEYYQLYRQAHERSCDLVEQSVSIFGTV